MKHGVVIGKFDPFHFGHLYCITTALLDGCDYVTVMVVNSITDHFPLEKRLRWISGSLNCYFRAKVIVIDDIYDDHNSLAWAEAMDELNVLAYPFTDLYGSEPYIQTCAWHLGVTPHIVDLNREAYPISATQIIEDPIANRHMLPLMTRGYFTRPIVVCGPESSGTTTIAKALASYYNAPYIPEYGRTYCENLEPDHIWTSKDFLHIAATQTKRIHDAAKHSDRPFVIADTDATTTYAFEKMYLGTASLKGWSLADKARRSFYELPLYIITAPTIPFVQDGMRIDNPEKQQTLFNDIMKSVPLGKRLILTAPIAEERISQAVAFLAQKEIN